MDELEQRLMRATGEQGPGAEATRRARSEVTAARPRRTRYAADLALPGGGRRLAGRLAATLAVLALVAAAVTLIVGTSPDDPPASPGVSGLPGVVRTCDAPADGASLLGCVEGAAERRLATPELQDAPWLYPGIPPRQRTLREAPPRPSLRFPPGIAYPEALSILYTWVAVVGTLPPGTSSEAPLPDGVVLLQPTDPGEGIAIDLRAPWGYMAGGRILSPSLTSAVGVPARPRPDELWARQSVSVPILPACQVISHRDAVPPPCTEGPIFDTGRLRAPDLPLIRVDTPPLTTPRIDYVDGPRCTFRAGSSGTRRGVSVEGDFVNRGTAGTGRFTGSVTLAGSGEEVTRAISRPVSADETTFTVRVFVPLVPSQRVTLVGGRPPCGVGAEP